MGEFKCYYPKIKEMVVATITKDGKTLAEKELYDLDDAVNWTTSWIEGYIFANESNLEISDLKEKLSYFTECQLATLEDLRDRKGFPKYELERHEDIGKKMVEDCRSFGKDKLEKRPRLLKEIEWKIRD